MKTIILFKNNNLATMLYAIMMRPFSYIVVALLILSGCHCSKQTNSTDFMKDIREDFSKQAKEFNNATLAWQSKIDMLYNRADIKLQDGVDFADSLIQFDKSLDKWKLSELHTIVGELYYDHDSTALALKRFQLDEQLTFDSPRNKANKAGCYTRMGDTALAMILLKEAAETNYDFIWFIGNLYEVEQQKANAIEQYDFLYKKDTAIYSYCKARIDQLNEPNVQLMTELYYKDRGQRTLLLLQGVDSTASPTKIGGLKLDKRKK